MLISRPELFVWLFIKQGQAVCIIQDLCLELLILSQINCFFRQILVLVLQVRVYEAANSRAHGEVPDVLEDGVDLSVAVKLNKN